MTDDADTATDAKVARLDRDGFAHAFTADFAMLRVVAAGEVGPSDADDVLQSAAIVAMRSLDRFEAGTNFRAWMATIVRNTARNHRRKGRRRERHERAAANWDSAPPARIYTHHQHELMNADANPSMLLAARQDASDVAESMGGLTPNQRTAVLLRHGFDLSYAEIAQVLGIAEATARSTVFRARARLLDELSSRWKEHVHDV